MATQTFSLDITQYEALIALARDGTKNSDGSVDSDKARKLDAFLRLIEKQNGVTRDAVWVQWQEMGEALPPTTNFPSVWPPEKRYFIELVTRRIARADVDQMLAARANKPINVLVTKDPGARLGWTPIDSFFVN